MEDTKQYLHNYSWHIIIITREKRKKRNLEAPYENKSNKARDTLETLGAQETKRIAK